MSAPTLEKRLVPETVAIPGELALNVLAHLEAAREVLASLNGRVDTAADDLYTGFATELDEAAFGPIPGDGDDELGDMPWHTDPINVEREARGSAIAAQLLQDLLASTPGGALTALLDREIRADVAASVWRLRENAAAVRLAGTLAQIRDDEDEKEASGDA